MVTLWSALLTKKRVLVYSSNVVELLKIVRALPLLVFHRQNWDVLRPIVVRNSIFKKWILLFLLFVRVSIRLRVVIFMAKWWRTPSWTIGLWCVPMWWAPSRGSRRTATTPSTKSSLKSSSKARKHVTRTSPLLSPHSSYIDVSCCV